ncbi:cell adhesion molecule Dscam1-like isoform X2 [Tachypleus tridentatus]|uniref:cell adhesion molecule Dscam1-like isoform X2 n=1 Tax=Tachypleus tridentatus TaxID=6853 RepID=UPI003FD0C9F8
MLIGCYGSNILCRRVHCHMQRTINSRVPADTFVARIPRAQLVRFGKRTIIMWLKGYRWIIVLFLFVHVKGLSASDTRGPHFVLEPNNVNMFYNTSGIVISCSASGTPQPVIYWTDALGQRLQDIPGLRHVRSDGSLIFSSFPVDKYQQVVHSADYRCVATNRVGTIGSRDVKVRAVIYQQFKVQVYDGYATRGNTGILRCHIPNYVRDYVTVTSWSRDDGHMIFPAESYDPHTSQAPRLLHFSKNIRSPEDSTAILLCLAHGFPKPRYAWYFSDNGRMTVLNKGQRIDQMDGTLVIRHVTREDAGTYFCMVSNDVGQERGEVTLDITAPLKASIYPEKQEVESGDPAIINCTVQGYPIHFVSWLKDQRTLVADGRITFPTQTTVRINPTRREDGGMYQCYVRNSEESVQDAARLTISAQPPILTSHFHDQVVNPGSQVSLTCASMGNPLPQITWSTYDEPVQDSNRVRVGDYVSRDGAVISFVNFTRIETMDGGTYRCTATNDNGVEVHQAQINVIGSSVIRPMKNKTIVGGTNVVISCPVGGYPIKHITWEKGSRQLPLGRRHSVFPNGTLVIRNVGRHEDQGTYVCSAKGKDGRSSKQSLHLQVLVPPVITPFSFPAAPREGLRTSVTCIVQEGDPPVQITWLKDGSLLEPDGSLLIEPTDTFMSTLIFKNLKPIHSATYTCVASNEAAVVNYSSPLIVNAPPRWKIEPTDLAIVTGSSTILHCQALGRPEPRVIWKKSTGELSNQYNTIISGARVQTLVNGSLVIHQVEQEDEGRYMCEAGNGVGSTISTVFKLSVHAPPVFQVKFTSLTVKEGNKANLVCEALGDKPIHFSWYKNHQGFQSKQQQRYTVDTTANDDVTRSELIIYSTSRTDSGIYMCQARNNWGSDDRNLQLKVLGIPDSPRKIEITKVESRSVSLSWSEPFDGNRKLNKYIVHYKQDLNTDRQVDELILEPDQREVTIRDLQPMTRYHFTLFAENDIGRSLPSDVIPITTDGEVPQDPPQDVEVMATTSHTLRVSWKAPALRTEKTKLQGYYVGHRIYGSDESYIYKTVRKDNNVVELSGLLPGRTYEVVVQPFNRKGAGSVSKEVIVQTLEFDPPKPVSLTTFSTTSSSVKLHWMRSRGDDYPVEGYLISFRPQDGNTWTEVQVSGNKNAYSITDLQCGKTYQFQVTAFNTMGKGEPSNIVSATTDGSVAVAPSQHELISFNSTTMTFNLDSWNDGGCSIRHFLLQYKSQGQMEWTVVGSQLYPEQETVVITDLKPGTPYLFLMAAVNSAGVTEEEYRAATLTHSGATIPPPGDTSPRSRYRSLYIIVPVCCATVVLISITVALFFILCRRRTSTSSNTYEGVRSVDEPKGDVVAMTDLEKQYGDLTESAYFPSPYATTRVPVFPREVMSRDGAQGCRSLVRSTTRGHDNNYDVPQPRRTKCKALFDQTSESRAGSDVSSECDSTTDRLDGYEQPRKPIRPKTLDQSGYPNSSLKGMKITTPSHGLKSDYSQGSLYSPIHLASSSALPDGLEPSDTECDRDLTDNKELVVKPKLSFQCYPHQQQGSFVDDGSPHQKVVFWR